jgi:thiamine-monophosphate kinase
MTTEDLFVERVKALAPGSKHLVVGIGDDAAVLAAAEGPLLATTDLLVEDVDFLPGEEPERLGRRAAAVNLSDLAAMGGRPEFFLLSVAFPRQLGADYPLAVARGALSRATPLGAVLAGGDLSDAPQTVVSIAFWGRPEGRPLLRSGALPGDLLYISGQPGRAAAGLRIARGQAPSALSPAILSELLAAYRDPEPRVALGRALAGETIARAAIDVSDGLGRDAARLARASGVRIVVQRERLPISEGLAAYAEAASLDPYELALGGGDDYELLFAAPRQARAKLDAGCAAWGVAVRQIGFCEAGAGVVLRDGSSERDIASLGFDHLEHRP